MGPGSWERGRRGRRSRKGEGTKANIDRVYVLIALLWLVAGELLGFYMGASGNLAVRDTHVAMVLPGFVVLTLYGALYRLWPAMKESALAKVQFWCAMLGVLALVIGAT